MGVIWATPSRRAIAALRVKDIQRRAGVTVAAGRFARAQSRAKAIGGRSRRPAARNSSRPGSSFRLSRPKCTRKAGVVTQRSGRPGLGAPALGAHPARFHQHVDRALSERHAADLLDFGARDRLVIGDHREGLDRRPRQLAQRPAARCAASAPDRARCETSSRRPAGRG